MGVIGGTNSIATDGLIFNMDPLNEQSWTGPNSSTTYNAVGPHTGSIFNDTSGSYGDNNSFDFDGTDDHIQLSNTINLGTTYSISFWFKTTQSRTSNGTWLAAGSGNGFTMLLLRNNLMMLFRGAGTDYNYGLQSITYNDGNWHNLTLTRNGTSAISTYLDTIDRSIAYAYGSGNLDTKLTFIGADGGTWGPAVPYNGQMGPIYFYNRVLSGAEITQNYNALKGRFGL